MQCYFLKQRDVAPCTVLGGWWMTHPEKEFSIAFISEFSIHIDSSYSLIFIVIKAIVHSVFCVRS